MVKVTVIRKCYATLRHPKMHLHTKFGIPTSKNIGDMHRTRSGTDGHTDGLTDGRTVRLLYASQSSFGGIKTVSEQVNTKPFFFHVKFKFSNDTSHIINLSACQHFSKKACTPCMSGTPFKFGYCLRCTKTSNSNNVIQSNSFTSISFIKRLAIVTPYYYVFLHTACLF